MRHSADVDDREGRQGTAEENQPKEKETAPRINDDRVNKERQGQPKHKGLVRSMSTLGVTALGVGAMIGAGVFVLTGMAAGEAGHIRFFQKALAVF